MDLELDNLQRSICHKTQTTKQPNEMVTSPRQSVKNSLVVFLVDMLPLAYQLTRCKQTACKAPG